MAGWAGKGKQDSAVAVYGGSLVLCALAPVSLSEEELFSGFVVWWLFCGLGTWTARIQNLLCPFLGVLLGKLNFL